MKDCHPAIEQMKAAYLDYLYESSGRADPSHPMHSLYTGLWDEHKEECANIARSTWWDMQEIDQ